MNLAVDCVSVFFGSEIAFVRMLIVSVCESVTVVRDCELM